MSAPGIIVGLSGGVDSSVTALLLQQRARRGEGPEVAGLFMRNWAEDDGGECRAEHDRRDAVKIAGTLGIPIHFRDFSNEYWNGVFEHFIAEYAAGRTPNPDVLCNKEIKFAHFLEAAHALGASCIATGHYARITHAGGHWQLCRARDRHKDQSYFLHQLGQTQLAVSTFPLGELEKPAVRALAREAGLATAEKKDSTGICFIGERNFREFLARWLPAQPGLMLTPDGHTVGEHPGVFYFTLGQREGLNLGGVRGFKAAPWYVVGKDVARNLLYVDQGHDSPWLHSSTLYSKPMHWIQGVPPAARFECHAQTRYRQPEEPCQVSIEDSGCIVVRFERPQRAVTPGQSVVLYQGDVCLGGAVIERTDAKIDVLETAR